MKIKTLRFGEIEVNEADVVHFRDGMVGLPKLKKFFFVESNCMPLVIWMQSAEDGNVAYPLIEPWFFKHDYKAPLNPADKAALGFQEGDSIRLLTVLTIPADPTQMSVNLKAPVAIDLERASGAQLILQDKELGVKVPAHSALTKALRSFPIQQSADEVAVEADEAWNVVNMRNTGKHGPSAGA